MIEKRATNADITAVLNKMFFAKWFNGFRLAMTAKHVRTFDQRMINFYMFPTPESFQRTRVKNDDDIAISEWRSSDRSQCS